MTVATDFIVVIPARYASSRLPGKPLLPVQGVPLVVRTWQVAINSGATSVVIATDDERIADIARAAGADVCMTASTHTSGTERIAEVAEQRGWSGDQIVVNLQGDEPFMPPRLVRQVADALANRPTAGIATLYVRIDDPREVFNPNTVKVVTNAEGLALTFSRAPIPWIRGRFPELTEMPEQPVFKRHLGLYAYRVETVRKLVAAPACAIEEAESLEQLRALFLGIAIHVGEATTPVGPGIDTPEDLAHAEQWMDESGERGGAA